MVWRHLLLLHCLYIVTLTCYVSPFLPCNRPDDNEILIAECGGLPVILDAARSSSLELQAQSARALRNLSVNQANKEILTKLDGLPALQRLAGSSNERISQQV